jgi:hypothetical protein
LNSSTYPTPYFRAANKHPHSTTPDRRWLLQALTLLTLLYASAGRSAVVTLEGITCNCQQSTAALLDCDYWPHTPEPLSSVTASMQGLTLPSTRQLDYPTVGQTSALLLLIDVSDLEVHPERLALKIRAVQQLAARLQSHHRLGVRTFNGQKGISVPLSNDPQAAVRAMANLGGAPHHRDLQLAIKTLANATADRKAIVFLTDGGLPADAYYATDIVYAAQAAGIIIDTLIGPTAPGLDHSVAALERLSRETGGTSLRLGTAANAATQLLVTLDAGQRISIDLGDAIRGGIAGARQVNVILSLPTRSLRFMVPVTLPAATTPNDQLTAQQPNPTSTTATEPTDWLKIAGLVLLGGCILALFNRRRRRPTGIAKPVPDSVATAGIVGPRPVYLIAIADGARHTVGKTPWRIGRADDSDLIIDHSSVSRNHAEIMRSRDDSYMIRDLDSLNGIFVEGNKIKLAALTEACKVDIGDIRFRFSFSAVDHGTVSAVSVDALPTD